MRRLPTSFKHALKCDMVVSLAGMGFLLAWCVFTIALVAVLKHRAVLTESNGGIFFLVVGIGCGALSGVFIQRAVARRIVPRCPHCRASLSVYLNTRRAYACVMVGRCPQCGKELSQPPPGPFRGGSQRLRGSVKDGHSGGVSLPHRES